MKREQLVVELTRIDKKLTELEDTVNAGNATGFEWAKYNDLILAANRVEREIQRIDLDDASMQLLMHGSRTWVNG